MDMICQQIWKCHEKRLNRSENIPKSYTGVLFETPCDPETAIVMVFIYTAGKLLTDHVSSGSHSLYQRHELTILWCRRRPRAGDRKRANLLPGSV